MRLGRFGGWRNWVYRVRQHLFSDFMIDYPFSFAMLSHRGRVRKGNEDTCAAAIEAGAFVVCDGMGGAAAGEVASSMAAERFLAALTPAHGAPPPAGTPASRMEAAVNAANQAVYQHSLQSPQLRGMGTTLVSLLVDRATPQPTTLTLANVGDSRCYRLRAGQLTRLTEDHSLVEEQVRSGELTPTEAEVHPWRNIITRAVGSQAQVQADVQELAAEPGDLYMLASDGLTRELSEERLTEILNDELAITPRRSRASRAGESGRSGNALLEAEPQKDADLASVCLRLINEANRAGGDDNITVLLVRLK